MSPIPLNWSEQNEPNASSLRDCSYSSALDLLVGAGYTEFPLGIFTVAEREALERSDDRADETGATPADLILAVKRRYGVSLHRFDFTTTASLQAALEQPGRIYSLAGQLKFLGDDEQPQRRWQKTYPGPHQVTVVTLPNKQARWLDPLAPMRFAGDTIPASLAARFAWQNYTALYLGIDELAPSLPDTATSNGGTEPMTTVTISLYSAPRVIRFKQGSYQAWDPAKSSPVKTVPVGSRGSWAHADASVQVTHSPQRVPNGWFYRMSDGAFEGLLIFQRDVTADPIPSPASVDVKAAVEAATDPLERRIAAMKQKVAALAGDIADD
jgi:hypothetical protein